MRAGGRVTASARGERLRPSLLLPLLLVLLGAVRAAHSALEASGCVGREPEAATERAPSGETAPGTPAPADGSSDEESPWTAEPAEVSPHGLPSRLLSRPVPRRPAVERPPGAGGAALVPHDFPGALSRRSALASGPCRLRDAVRLRPFRERPAARPGAPRAPPPPG